MSDEPEIPLEEISRRELHGFTIKKLDKSGSSLHVLTQPDRRIVRNSEIPATSMATWNFLSRYAHTLFSDDFNKKLFGPWGRPQVIPIIENNGKPKIYYHDEKASAYSEIAGYNTYLMTNILDLNEITDKYAPQSSFQGELRSYQTLDYYLTTDLLDDIPDLDSNGEIRDLLENYWDEFNRLNENRTPRSDLLQARELRRNDLDGYESRNYQSSLLLIETSHQLAQKFAELYRELEESDSSLLWNNKPVKDLALLLTHHYQTTSQQVIM